ncbi:hypothetical protein ONS95_003771 [Cadophora gregata]|uniref:uncharacterized protein n=1 Tax=Cadophora gregata TaxID=51156 RepID=UPI0026DCE1BA|nr:uncharacterized protein ONS95_003771 [Cadophora gregata]KAK0107061.1 hypothetical protein ONS95_003771 [Cadophora gregata]
MDSIIPIFRRSRLSHKSKDQIPMSDMASNTCQISGFFRLPLEIRLEIYAHLFSNKRFQSAEGKPEKYMIPFDHASRGFMFASHQVLAETINYLFQIPRITFPRPELCSLILTTSRSLLNRLSILEVTLKAYETQLLEPIFDMIIAAQVPLSSLTLNLVPTYPGQLVFPVPRYLILREEFQLRAQFEGGARPWAPRCHHDHSFFVYHFNDFGTGGETVLSQSSIGSLTRLRHLTVTGQPEFSQDFELAILKLHGAMQKMATREGKDVELADCCGLQNGGFHFEVWIS